MADACYLSCGMIYENNEWVETGGKIPTVFISVELDMEELQTMAWSFISGVPENHILENKYDFDEYDRVIKAIQILKDAPLWFEYLPDYDLKDVENCIKRNIRVHKTSCVFLDYLTSSMKLLEQVSKAGGGMRVREDQILLFLSAKLKDIAQQFHIFIFSSTQLSAQFKQEKYPDQTLLAGAKAIANKVDFGEILLDMTPEDCDDIAPLARQIGEMPNIKCSVYKNRRGKTNRVFLWMKADKGTCRYRTLFVTDYNLNLIEEP
jgi:replicative DNA helicase